MNTGGVPSCEWPDAKRPATFRNCCDKDGRPDQTLERRAAVDRIEAITKQLDCTPGLMNKKRSALWHERDRFERKFGLGRFSLVAEKDDQRKQRATEKQLRRLGNKKAAQANLPES
jgi:hypothetical protein